MLILSCVWLSSRSIPVPLPYKISHLLSPSREAIHPRQCRTLTRSAVFTFCHSLVQHPVISPAHRPPNAICIPYIARILRSMKHDSYYSLLGVQSFQQILIQFMHAPGSQTRRIVCFLMFWNLRHQYHWFRYVFKFLNSALLAYCNVLQCQISQSPIVLVLQASKLRITRIPGFQHTRFQIQFRHYVHRLFAWNLYIRKAWLRIDTLRCLR